MAATLKDNVIVTGTNGDTVDQKVRACGIKVLGGASGVTFTIKSGTSSGGTAIYSCTVAANAEKFEEVHLDCRDGMYFGFSASGGTAYIYRA